MQQGCRWIFSTCVGLTISAVMCMLSHRKQIVNTCLCDCRKGQTLAENNMQHTEPLQLSDFQAALKTYQPTQWKAERFQAPAGDPMAAMLQLVASMAHLGNNGGNGNTYGNNGHGNNNGGGGNSHGSDVHNNNNGVGQNGNDDHSNDDSNNGISIAT